MIWYGWLSLGVALTGWVMTWRRIAWVLAHEFGEPDTEDMLFALAFGALVALAWPVILPVFALYRLRVHASPILWRFLRPPSHIARERELTQRERHIVEMERELGIGRK